MAKGLKLNLVVHHRQCELQKMMIMVINSIDSRKNTKIKPTSTPPPGQRLYDNYFTI